MKKLWFIPLALLFLLTLAGCASSNGLRNGENNNETTPTLAKEVSVPERKMVYRVSMNIHTSDINDAIADVKALLNANEWDDQVNYQAKNATLVLRVETARLDAFIEQIKEQFETSSYSKTGTDISLQYQDVTIKIDSLTKQLARLNALYETASTQDMILLNEQITKVETELLVLKGELKTFDSLVDYSTVTIYLTQAEKKKDTSNNFFVRIWDGIQLGFSGLVTVIETLIVAIATLLPFIIVFGGIGLGIAVIIKRKKSKKTNK